MDAAAGDLPPDHSGHVRPGDSALLPAHAFLWGSTRFPSYNDKNERVWCKFHFRTQQGIKNLTDAEAEALIAKDRESHGRDLYEAIERGEYPRWTMYVQIMTEEQALKHYENL